jgi:hypothetical protein
MKHGSQFKNRRMAEKGIIFRLKLLRHYLKKSANRIMSI